MKILCAYVTTEADEPQFQDCFIAGYEAAGGTWTGTIDVIEHIGTGNSANPLDNLMDTVEDANAAGYSAVIHNYGIGINGWIILGNNETRLQTCYENGTVLFAAAGSNTWHESIYGVNFQSSANPALYYSPVICGAGVTQNLGGYHCELFDEDPFAESLNILSITQLAGGFALFTFSPNFTTPYINSVVFSNITGFSNNPDGNFKYEYLTTSTFDITHDLGSGSFVSGNAHLHFQSYSTPYIAGKFMYYMDTVYGGEINDVNCDEARRVFRVTADYPNTQYSGFGKLNLAEALAYGADSSPSAPSLTPGTMTISRPSSGVLRLTWDIINDADRYEIYRNTDLIETIDVKDGQIRLDYQISGRSTPSNRYRFRYRGVTDSRNGAFSNTVSYPYMQSQFILTRPYA